MAIDQLSAVPWTRKHDDPAAPVLPSASRIMYPKSLEELIEICATRKPADRVRGAGSHWALSEAAVSDNTFVETHDPNGAFQALGKTLYDVVPGCLHQDFVNALLSRSPKAYDQDPANVQENEGLYPIHIETGKRVYQLYAELDEGDGANPQSLAFLLNQRGNPNYLGSWGFRTLGGAGGQTVFGALATGTHGGDFKYLPSGATDRKPFPPIADSVMALHLVADGGRHYWIEPESLTEVGTPLTDDLALKALYGRDRYRGRQNRGRDNFDIIRDDTVFDSVLVSAGRFGIVYSLVMSAVRQYTLHEERRLDTWQNVMDRISDPSSDLYDRRFLQLGICLTTHENFSKNLCGVTKRWNVPLATPAGSSEPFGRSERRGPIGAFNTGIQAPLFEFAGNSHAYGPNPNEPNAARDLSFLERACSDASFMEGVIDVVAMEIQDFIDSNGVAIGATIAAVAVVAPSAALVLLIPALIVLLALLLAFLALLQSLKPRLGQSMNDLKDLLLNRTDPRERAAGIFIWQCIAFQLFSSQQKDLDYEAISYAVMDKHDYFDKSCNINVDSIEVFFNAKDPMLSAFIDALITFEIGQEAMGLAFVGFASMRFMGPSRALLGMQQHEVTCAVEVAGLRDVTGSKELIDFALSLALNPNFNAIVHWGQRNEATRAQVQRRFGDTAANASGSLYEWRNALSRITEHGKLDGFSSAFTRQTGLEIVTPRIGTLQVNSGVVPLGQPFTIVWECDQNPPATEVALEVVSPTGAQGSFGPLPLVGQQEAMATEAGVYTARLTAAIGLSGERREVTQAVSIQVA